MSSGARPALAHVGHGPSICPFRLGEPCDRSRPFLSPSNIKLISPYPHLSYVRSDNTQTGEKILPTKRGRAPSCLHRLYIQCPKPTHPAPWPFTSSHFNSRFTLHPPVCHLTALPASTAGAPSVVAFPPRPLAACRCSRRTRRGCSLGQAGPQDLALTCRVRSRSERLPAKHR